MPAFSFQKQSARKLVLAPFQQAAYGGVLADAKLTQLQQFDPSTVFEKDPTFQSDKEAVGKGTEFATYTQKTAWDTKATLKASCDTWITGWMLAFTFGQEVVTGAAGAYTHTFTIPPINATMPCTTVYVEETAAVKFKMQDMAAKSFSLDVPERGWLMGSLDLVGSGAWTPGAMAAALPVIATPGYLLGSDMVVTITPAAGAAAPFAGRQKSISIKIDRGSAPFKSSGDGLYAGSVQSASAKFSFDVTIAALQTDEVNGWFESGIALNITIATNPALTSQVGFTLPLAYVKANKLGNTEDKVMWQLSFDETTCLQNGNQAAISAFVVNTCPSYLTAA